jgi:YVTN family beta-propeller protein
VDFHILGPLEVVDQGRELSLTGGKQSALLAILLLHPNEVVPSDRLIDELWGERTPATAAKSLQVHVSRLRAAFEDSGANGGDGVVLTRSGGYLVRVRPGELDRDRFERLVQEASGALGDGDARRALELLREAFALWRGPPLADFAYEGFAQKEIARLEELHLTAVELRIEAELALGQHAHLIGELETLVELHPYRERLRAQLMLALYRAGRQTEALQAYQRARKTLVDEVGVEPGDELRALERAVLAQDPALDRPAAADVAAPEAKAPTAPTAARTAPPERRRARSLAPAVMLLGACGIVALALVVLVGHDDSSVKPPLTDDSHAVAVIDPSTNEVDQALSVGTGPASLAFDRKSGSLWVANVDDETVTHIDPERRQVGQTIPIRGAPTGLAADGGALWVASSRRRDSRVTLTRINTGFDTVEQTERVGDLAGYHPHVALGGGVLWVAPELGLLTPVDPQTGSERRPPIETGHSMTDLAVSDDGTVWVVGEDANTVTRVDGSSGATTPIPVGNVPTGVTVGAGAVWVTLALDDALVRIDARTGAVQKTIAVGRSPVGVAVGAGAVWVANSGDGTVSRIDPKTDEVVTTIPVGAGPEEVAVGAGRVFVSVRPRTLPEAKPGGTLRVELTGGLSTTDTALLYGVMDWVVSYEIGALLLNHPDASGPTGSELEPELAASLPARSKDGRTYTFTIRKGFRFSPPSGEPVTAATMKYSIERVLSPKMESWGATFASDIVGATDYIDGKADHIAGITTDGDKLTFRLVRPAGDFPARISMPFFAAVPDDTPIDAGLGKVASAGPYYVASFDEDEGALLKRNSNYHGSRPRRPRQIRFTFGTGRRQALADVESGAADYAPVTDSPTKPSEAAPYARRYGPRSEAAKSGRQRYFINPTMWLDHISLNTSRPLFASARLRRAVNYAIDRTALARQGGINFLLRASPTDQYLPPGMPGFADARLYPFRPNLEKARRLAGPEHRTATLHAYSDSASAPQLAQIVKSNLKRIGIDVEIKLFKRTVIYGKRRYDMLMGGFGADLADPENFLGQLDGRTLDEGSYLNRSTVNMANFDDPGFNRRLLAAERLSGPRRYIAYSRIEHDMVRDAAPWIAFSIETSHDFFSARTGCQIYQPVYGIDLGALCIRKSEG